MTKEIPNFEWKGDTSEKSNQNLNIEKQKLEDKNNQVKDYPAVRFLSSIASFLAKAGIYGSIVGYIIYIYTASSWVSNEQKIIMFFVVAIATFIYFVYWKAISELLIIFVDIAQDTRKIRLNKEK